MPATAAQHSSANATCFRADRYALATAARTLQGIAVGCVLDHAARLPVFTKDVTWMWPVLVSSALACGMGCGTAVDRQWQLRFKPRWAPVLNLMVLACGLALIGITSESLILAALLIGAGAGTDWSSIADTARDSLSAGRRWNGMRWWSAAFPGGLAIGVLVNLSPGILPFVILATIGVGFGFAVLPPSLNSTQGRSTSLSRQSGPENESVAGQTAAVVTAADQVIEPDLMVSREEPFSDSISSERRSDTANQLQASLSISPENAADDRDPECDAAECCGGSSRAFQPASFAVGTGLAVVGSFVLLGPVFSLWQLTIDAGSMGGTLSLLIGFAAGFVLMATAAPHAGYTVSLLPFLVLSIPAVLAAAAVSPRTTWAAVVYFPAGLLSGGVVQGVTALIGEQFFDCPTDSQRTRLLSVSLFVTALLILAAGFFRYWRYSAATVTMAECAVFLLGICLIRAIPTPLISSLGKDGTDDETDAELQDVVAAINN